MRLYIHFWATFLPLYTPLKFLPEPITFYDPLAAAPAPALSMVFSLIEKSGKSSDCLLEEVCAWGGENVPGGRLAWFWVETAPRSRSRFTMPVWSDVVDVMFVLS